jgi:surface antigen
MKYFSSKVLFLLFFLLSFIISSHFFMPSTFASTQSNCVEVQKGTTATNATGGCDNGEGGTDCNGTAVNCAEYIVNTFKASNCPRATSYPAFTPYAYLRAADINCMPTTLPENIKNGLANSVNGDYDARSDVQCLGFVQTVGAATGHPVRTPGGGLYGTAVSVWSNPPPKYQVTQTPEVGDTAVFSGLTAGHIAFVAKVNPNNTVQMAEANGDGMGSVDYFTYNRTGDNGIGLTILGYLKPI